ncbi:MAG: alpha/beta hydrolase [Chloroflexi bacterium]|nr:alpha/beta hydrolase [Chloroflexota bacterium]
MSNRSVFTAGVLASLAALLLLASSVVAQGSPSPAAVLPPQAQLQPMPAGGTEGTAQVNGIDLRYVTYGSGDPVILLHGGLANGDYWANQIPAWSDAHQLIVVDSRGHGRSTFDQTPITYDLLAADVLALMDELGLPKASIVGWSDGGIIGLDIAIHHPDRLDLVVAYGANFDPSGLIPGAEEDQLFGAYIGQASADYLRLSPDPSRWEEFLGNIGVMWATEPSFTPEELGSITTPFLILDGAQEEAIDPAHTRLMASLIPGSQLMFIPDTGHFAMFERPDEFDAIVSAFLAGDPVEPSPAY